MKGTAATFHLLTAFSSEIDGGNPAAVVFMDLTRPIDVYQNIAQNLNQPVTSFISPRSQSTNNLKRSLSFAIRWFGFSRNELALCVHGTFAAAKVIFEMNAETQELEFHSTSGRILTAQKCDDGYIEIGLQPAEQACMTPEEDTRLRSVLMRAFGKPVAINYVARGKEVYEKYLMVELDEKENLKNLVIDSSALCDTGFKNHVFTTVSTEGTEKFVSRMFAVPGDEDHVCGSAHGVITPYWYNKLGIPRGCEIEARQVSRRGGQLKLLWEADRNILRLKGVGTILAKGELYIP